MIQCRYLRSVLGCLAGNERHRILCYTRNKNPRRVNIAKWRNMLAFRFINHRPRCRQTGEATCYAYELLGSIPIDYPRNASQPFK